MKTVKKEKERKRHRKKIIIIGVNIKEERRRERQWKLINSEICQLACEKERGNIFPFFYNLFVRVKAKGSTDGVKEKIGSHQITNPVRIHPGFIITSPLIVAALFPLLFVYIMIS